MKPEMPVRLRITGGRPDRIVLLARELAALLDGHLAATRATKRARRAMARAWIQLGAALDSSGFRLDDLRSIAGDLGLEYAVIPRDEGALLWASVFSKASSPWSPGRLAA